MNNKCNKRVQKTTRKVVAEEFYKREKPCLLKLPNGRYETYVVEKRRVNRYGHISFKYNYYSVPHEYIGEEVSIKAGRDILKIYSKDYTEIALHPLNKGTGNFITNENHISEIKRRKGPPLKRMFQWDKKMPLIMRGNAKR